MKEPGFHAKDGWYFNRLSDGSVAIQSPDGAAVVLDRDTWASAVASVSNAGDTAQQHADALHLHDWTVEDWERWFKGEMHKLPPLDPERDHE